MNRTFQILLYIIFCLLFITPVKAQKAEMDKNIKPSIEEKLIRLEEGQNSLEKGIDDLRSDIQAKFNRLYILLSSIIALNGIMVGSVIWLARQDRPVGQRHYDQLLDNDQELERKIRRLSKDVELIKARLELTE